MFKITSSHFDKLLEKATNRHNLEPDLTDILQICDLIRGGECPPKQGIASIKKKLANPNPHTVLHTLRVLESMMKNCGHVVHDEVATKAFMDIMRDVLKSAQTDTVKQKTLELLQTWAHAFRSTPKYKAVQDVVTTLKSEGYKFPAMEESDAMFSADSAPEWRNADECHHCRVSFSTFRRKHHCRACGHTFCSECSSKMTTLPQYGIEKEVRVCDTCYEATNKNRAASPSTKSETETLPAEYVNSSLAQQAQAPKTPALKDEEAEREELELALALSQSEAEAKEREKKRATAEIISAAQRTKTPTFVKEEEEEDSEMARYLNRSYWEQRQGKGPEGPKPTSPDRYGQSPPSAPESPTHHQVHNGMSEVQLNSFVSYLKGQLEMFVNRMKSNSSRGRSISTDSSVQTLFLNVTNHHSKLLEYIHEQDDLRVYYEGLQDKLAQVKDAMGALEALRDEHQEKLRREAEEAERQKQLQMAHKLQIMRKKKQEYLEHQRQLAIHRVQEQEREMQMRKEQQKQQYIMGGMPQYMMGPYQGGYGPQGPMMMPGQGYLPPGYPIQQHGMPPGGQQSLPPHLQHMGQPQMGGQPMSMPPNLQGHPAQMHPQAMPPGMQQGPQSMPSGMQQGPPGMLPGMQQGPPGMQPGMQQGPPSMQPGMQQGPPGIPPGPQGIPQGMPQPQQGMAQPRVPPGVQQSPQNLPQVPSMPQQQGIPQQQQNLPPGIGPQHMIPGYPPGVMPQHPMGAHPGAPMQGPGPQMHPGVPQGHPGMQPGAPAPPYQQMPPQSPQESTAELIRFD